MQDTLTLAELSPSHRSLASSYRSDVGLDDDVAWLQRQLHECRLDLAESVAEKEQNKLLLENEREEAKLRRNGAAEAAQQQISRAETKAAAYREEADTALSALAAANVKLQEAESWRQKANAHERNLSIAQHAQQVSEANHSRVLSEMEAMQAQTDSTTRVHAQLATEHAEELRSERHSREMAEHDRLELERTRDNAERTVGSLQERLEQVQAAHAEALADISSMRTSLDVASNDARKHEADAHAWEERAHAAIAEATRRGHQETAAGSATVALLTSDIASTKQLLHVERASKAELASELASVRTRLETSLAEATQERDVALDEVTAAREEAEVSARIAAEHIQSGVAAQQTSEVRINALRTELTETRADARRHAAAVSSVKTAAGAAHARVEADSADIRRCLRVAEATAKVHADEANALEVRNGKLQHKLTLFETKYQAVEDQNVTLTRENHKLQEDVKRLLAEDRRKDLERSTVDSSMRKKLAEHEATIAKMESEIGTGEAALAAAVVNCAKHESAVVEAEKRLAKQEQVRIEAEAKASAVMEQAAASAHENTTATMAELSERVIRLHDELHSMHDATATAAAKHSKALTEEAELAKQWQLRHTEAMATEQILQAQVTQLANETAATKDAEACAMRDIKVWKDRAEKAIEEAAAAHRELAELGGELQSLHSLHRQSVSERRAEGDRLRSEVSTHGAAAEHRAQSVAQLQSELRHSKQENQLMAARAEQSAQLAFGLQMQLAQAEAEELRRQAQMTANARHRAENLTGLLSARRSSLSETPSPTRKSAVHTSIQTTETYRGVRQRPTRGGTDAIALSPRQIHGSPRPEGALSSAAAAVSGTIGQHLSRHSHRYAAGTSNHDPRTYGNSDSLASLLESPATSYTYSADGASTPARSEAGHETTLGVLSMLEGLQI